MIAWVAVASLVLLYFWFKWSCATQIILPFTDLAITAQTERTAQIFASLFVCFGVIIAIVQYLISSNQHKKWAEAQIEDVKARRTQKAIEQAGFYKDQILDKILIIRLLYETSGIKEILDEIKPEAMVEFDFVELRKNLTNAQIKKIEGIVRSEAFFNTLTATHMMYDCFCIDPNDVKEKLANIKSANPNVDDNSAKKACVKEMYMKEFSNFLMGALNNLEFFAMYFVHNSADESVIFQSLHQTYIIVVRLLYFDICRTNSSPGIDKYFVSILGLYSTWNNRVNDKERQLVENSRKAAK